jgi:predicted DsbA family dithiol-disulfide isomerase
VRWLPFQLNRDIPPGGISRADYLERKFGTRTRSYDRVAAAGAVVGIPFAFDRITVQPNTNDAHRLLVHAEQAHRQDEMADALFRAYFTQGANLADREALADVAASAGLDREEIAAYLASDADREVVLQADETARHGGIGGVPFFIFNRKLGVSGAQGADVLLDALEQSLE